MTKFPTFRVQDQKASSYHCIIHKTIVHSEKTVYGSDWITEHCRLILFLQLDMTIQKKFSLLKDNR